MSARYAIYYVPAADSALGHVGQRWLGRDVFTGERISRRMTLGLPKARVDELTQSAAHYGLHATLKAPFELCGDVDEECLCTAARDLTANMCAIDVPLAVGAIGDFLAMLVTDNAEAVRDLHRTCLEYFEPFRAPLSEYDRQRRLKAPLTEAQISALDKFGYPYILDDFRFHITLTNRISDADQRQQIQKLLSDIFDHAWSEPHIIDAISILKQDDREQPFRVIGRYPFGNRQDEGSIA